ncbi:MAG: glycosyltransferase family 2 protein [Candidatus Falkowbacteria bacterium]
MNYLKIGKATELSGRDRKIYRLLEILPGFLSIGTLLLLIVFSYFQPVWVAYFIIAFDVYWLLLVIFLAIYLIAGYKKMKENKVVDWEKKCRELSVSFLDADSETIIDDQAKKPLCEQGVSWEEIIHMVVLPNYNEDLDILRTAVESLIKDGYPTKNMIVVLAMEERAGVEIAHSKAEAINSEFGVYFRNLFVTYHPGEIEGELKGKGANQAWAAKKVKEEIVDKEGLDYNKILVSVFDIDTVVFPGYFFKLTHSFLTVSDPYHASYQPIPIYHNNVWQAPFFARVASSSNTFWQMMQQIRPEKLSTYSSHSMTWKALVDIGFWSTNMVSEDSRIFWNCLLYYNGNYRVEPLYFPVFMDTTMDASFMNTAKSLYKQQRRWAWGSENVPYLIFNTAKKWKEVDHKVMLRHIFVQVYGFHSWATNALIIAVVGWMPMLLGGDRFNSTVLSGNLPQVSSALMNLALVGMVLSATISTILLPKRPKGFSFFKNILVVLEWVTVPVTIIFFGALPCLDAQWRLMRGKYMGFWVTPKSRR